MTLEKPTFTFNDTFSQGITALNVLNRRRIKVSVKHL